MSTRSADDDLVALPKADLHAHRLIHLNGPPGVGKSTIAGMYTDRHPGVLNCDIDVLRSLIGGWADDFAGAGARIRPAALAMIHGYLLHSGDVVLPQLLARTDELEKFDRASADAGAEFVEVVLTASVETVLARFHSRPHDGPVGDEHRVVSRVVAAEGGTRQALLDVVDRLDEIVRQRSAAIVVDTDGLSVEETYAIVQAALERCTR